MNKSWPALLLAGALALSLAACSAPGAGEPSASPSAAVSDPVTEPSVPVISVEPEASETPMPESPAPESPAPTEEPGAPIPPLPEREYQPWQTGYMDFLTALFRAERDTRPDSVTYKGLAVDRRGVKCLDAGRPLAMITVMAMGAENYSLHDVDGDGVPELFVKYGNCEAAFTTQCYAYREGQVVCVGEFSSGHSSLYTDPGKSAVLRSEGHMGYKEVYEYPMEGGVLTEEREIFSEEDVREYTETAAIVPGAEYIPEHRAQLGEWNSWETDTPKPSDGKALLLPLCDWYDGSAATGNSTEAARGSILAVLNGEAELYGACGDGFCGDTGRTTWEEYVKPDVAYPYIKEPFQISKHVWLDLNGDGQEECVLWLESEEPGAEWSHQGTTVLSAQGGQVYAYYFFSFDDGLAELYADGTFRGTWQGDVRLSFWRDQCYEYAVQGDASARPVKWVDGPPAA